MKKQDLNKKFIRAIMAEDFSSAKAALQSIMDRKLQKKITEAYKDLKEKQ
jgi:hypothetical protein